MTDTAASPKESKGNTDATVKALRYNQEFSTDFLRGWTQRIDEIFLPEPYCLVINNTPSSQWSTSAQFNIFRADAARLKSKSSFGDPGKEAQDCREVLVPKAWADQCRKFVEMQEEANKLGQEAVAQIFAIPAASSG